MLGPFDADAGAEYPFLEECCSSVHGSLDGVDFGGGHWGHEICVGSAVGHLKSDQISVSSQDGSGLAVAPVTAENATAQVMSFHGAVDGDIVMNDTSPHREGEWQARRV